MADFTMFQIELSKNYDNAAWKDDLKRLLRLAGEKGDSTVFCCCTMLLLHASTTAAATAAAVAAAGNAKSGH